MYGATVIGKEGCGCFSSHVADGAIVTWCNNNRERRLYLFSKLGKKNRDYIDPDYDFLEFEEKQYGSKARKANI